MKLKSRIALNSILICGLAAAAPADANNPAALRSAEASVRTFEAKGKTDNASYVFQLIGLAHAYVANGRRAEANATFRKAIAVGSQLNNFDVPGSMLSWALSLTYKPMLTQGMTAAQLKEHAVLEAAYEADLPNAEKIVLEGLEMVSKLPVNSESRLNYMIGTIKFYKSLGRTQQVEARLKAVDTILQSLEHDPKLQNADIPRIAEKFMEISRTFCESPANLGFTAMFPKTLATDAEPPNPLLARQSDFKISEGYELRAIKLFDRLPESDYSRIEAHRRLAKWYRFFNQTKEENFQIQVLSKLLHTTDPTILFPKFDPCYGCGRG